MKDRQRQATGRLGEQMAVDYLSGKGFCIEARNYRYKKSEIDIIAMKGDTLIFFEVKTRSGNDFGFPEESVSMHQANQIVKGAEQYIHECNWHGNIRFDIIGITLGPCCELRHFEDAFY